MEVFEHFNSSGVYKMTTWTLIFAFLEVSFIPQTATNYLINMRDYEPLWDDIIM